MSAQKQHILLWYTSIFDPEYVVIDQCKVERVFFAQEQGYWSECNVSKYGPSAEIFLPKIQTLFFSF
jgi:hypothetical protein